VYGKEKYLKEIVTPLALCHNVTPVYEVKKCNTEEGQSEQSRKLSEEATPEEKEHKESEVGEGEQKLKDISEEK
jgi:hypothetical protein